MRSLGRETIYWRTEAFLHQVIKDASLPKALREEALGALADLYTPEGIDVYMMTMEKVRVSERVRALLREHAHDLDTTGFLQIFD